MYKNNKKSKKNRSKPQNSNPKKSPSETLTTPSENLRKPEEPQENKFSPGKIIELTGLSSKPELNGRHGVIRKKLENGRYRIMIGNETDLAINKPNFKTLEQCLSEQRLKISGILIWPHITGVSAPSMQWINDDYLTRSFINPFDRNGPFKHYWAQPDWKQVELCMSAVVEDEFVIPQFNRSVIMRDYETRLKKLLNWKNPTMWINTHFDRNICAYWDGDSKAPINDVLKRRCPIEVSYGNFPETRGPVICIEGVGRNLYCQTKISMTSLNVQRALFELKTKETETAKKANLRFVKLLTSFPICKTSCEHCLDGYASGV